MKNICRPFILYNDFFPPVSEAHSEWQYLSFGYYDGVSVGEDLLEDGKCNFNALWEYYVTQGERMNGSYSALILWGLRCEKEEAYDSYFWVNGTAEEYPYLFLTLLQMKISEVPGILDEEARMKLEKDLTVTSRRKAITYLTFDNSDLILILRCKNYKDGADIINKFHDIKEDRTAGNKWELNYSFTVASVDKRFLSNNEWINRAEGSVTHAYIYMIEKCPGSVNYVYNEIKKEIKPSFIVEKEAVLGCNDEVVVIQDVPWSEFLKLYQDKTGILNHTHAIYKKGLIGVTTIIGEKQEHDRKNMDGEVPEGLSTNEKGSSTREKTFCDKMREKCSQMGEGRGTARMEAVKRNIYQVINALHKFERTPFSDYMFQTVFLPLNMAIDMSQEIKEESINDFYDSFYDFMKGLNLYSQNLGRSDRQFTQIPDMNIRIYETPVKLNAFYNAFIFYLKQYLNDLDRKEEHARSEREHEYEFLACPGVTDNMQVQELFKTASTTKRLFLVEMPENQVYKPDMMLVMLAHEVAHFVGKNIRNREERFVCAEKIAGKIVVKYFRAKLQEYFKNKPEEYGFIQNDIFWSRTEEMIVSKLRIFDENYKTYLMEEVFQYKSDDERAQCQEQIEWMMEHRRKHSEVLRMILIDGILEILKNDDNRMWDYLCERDFLYWIEKDAPKAIEKKLDLKLKIKEIIHNFTTSYPWNDNTISVWSTTELMIDLFKECIADLIAILTLKLSMLDYFKTILQSIKDQEIEDILDKKTELLIRSSLITTCMSYDRTESGYIWKKDSLEAVNQSGDQEIIKLKTAVLNFMDDYLGAEGQRRYEDSMGDAAVDMLADADNLHIILGYLLKSKLIFKESNYSESVSGTTAARQTELIQLYQLFSNENIEDLTLTMQRYIGKYLDVIKQRNKMYAEIRGTTNEAGSEILC